MTPPLHRHDRHGRPCALRQPGRARRLVALVACMAGTTAGALAQTPTVNTPVQDAAAATPDRDARAPHRWSVSWGWNRSQYSHSDIHFTGQDHDFWLRDVNAHDTQTPLNLQSLFKTYLHPGRITIPQTNLRLAYRLSEDSAVALNLDHMKYVMTTNQAVPISGTIRDVTQTGTQVLSPDFLAYEHTDGLNLITGEYEQFVSTDLFGLLASRDHARLFGLVGAGVAFPKSNVTLAVMGQPRNDQFHIAGYTVHAGLGLEVDLWQRYFVRGTAKAGWVELPDVWTSARRDQAAQHFGYQELILAVGVRF